VDFAKKRRLQHEEGDEDDDEGDEKWDRRPEEVSGFSRWAVLLIGL
jgi:hypothetical protein